MPIYEFQCHHCGGRIEELMRLSDPDPTDCPSCKQPGLKRMLSAPSFRLAGSGWYETDFKKDGKRNIAGDSGGDTKPAESGSSSAETKPVAKSESKGEGKDKDKSKGEGKGEAAKSPAPAANDSKKPGSPPPAS